MKTLLGAVQIGTGCFIWWAYDWKASLSCGLMLSCMNLRLLYREVIE